MPPIHPALFPLRKNLHTLLNRPFSLVLVRVLGAGRLRCRLIETGISTIDRLKPCRASVKNPEHLNFSLHRDNNLHVSAAIRRRGE